MHNTFIHMHTHSGGIYIHGLTILPIRIIDWQNFQYQAQKIFIWMFDEGRSSDSQIAEAIDRAFFLLLRGWR